MALLVIPPSSWWLRISQLWLKEAELSPVATVDHLILFDISHWSDLTVLRMWIDLKIQTMFYSVCQDNSRWRVTPIGGRCCVYIRVHSWVVHIIEWEFWLCAQWKLNPFSRHHIKLEVFIDILVTPAWVSCFRALLLLQAKQFTDLSPNWIYFPQSDYESQSLRDVRINTLGSQPSCIHTKVPVGRHGLFVRCFPMVLRAAEHCATHSFISLPHPATKYFIECALAEANGIFQRRQKGILWFAFIRLHATLGQRDLGP